MLELDTKSRLVSLEDFPALKPIRIKGCLIQLPSLEKDEVIICGLDLVLYEQLYICESLEDMQALWVEYVRGAAVAILWYKTNNSVKDFSLRK